jgi:tetratricopeptide (TPR) repeat protein
MSVHIRTLVAAAALSFAAALHADTGSADLQFYRQKIASANALMQSENFVAADHLFATIVDSPVLQSLPPEDARSTLGAAGWTAARAGDLPRARTLLLRANAVDDGDPDVWYRLALVEHDLEHHDAAARDYVELAERWPELLGNIDTDFLYALLGKLDAASAAKLDLLQALFDANWDDPENDPSNLWYDLAVFRVERGEADRARSAARRVTAPRELIRLRTDKRFDAIVDRDTWAFNVEAAAKHTVEAMEAKAARDPRKLDPRVQQTYAMLVAGMDAQVVSLVDGIVATIADAPADAPPFEDMEQQVWLMNNRAIALRRLDRIDEAEAELRRAGELTERGSFNVSQALNLGAFYCSLGRADDALAALERTGDAISGYGRMVENLVRLCAATHQRDAAAAKRALSYLREHRRDGQLAYLEGLIRAGQEKLAAKQLIGLLESRADRGDALEWLQETNRPEPLPGDRPSEANYRKVLARDEVRAAIEHAGRIERYGVNISFGME